MGSSPPRRGTVTSVAASGVPPRLRPLLAAAAPLAAVFDRAGRHLYLVGGSVRDALMGDVDLDGVDLDLHHRRSARGDPRIVRPAADQLWEQGKAVRDDRAAKVDRADLRDHDAPRRGLPIATRASPTVTFGDDVEVDLSRRDFTINAMALDLATLTLRRPVREGRRTSPSGGSRPRSTPRSPSATTRCACCAPRGSSRASSSVPDAALVAAATDLATAPRDRLRRADPRRARQDRDWSRCRRSRCGSSCAPASPTSSSPSSEALALEQDPIHRHKDVLAHTLAVVDKTSNDRLLRLAALFHDVGKPKTRAIGPDGVSFHHHEVVGARMTRARMPRPCATRRTTSATVTRLVELHLRFHTYKMGWTDRADASLRPRCGRAPRSAERAHALRLHHAQRRGARGVGSAHGRARGPDRRAARARGAATRCGRSSTATAGDGAARHPAGARRG